MSVNLGVLDIGIEVPGLSQVVSGLKEVDTAGERAARGGQLASRALRETGAASQAAAAGARQVTSALQQTNRAVATARVGELAGSLRSTEAAGAQAGRSLSRLRGPLSQLATGAAGANRAVAGVTGELAMMAMGNPAAMAALAGVMAVGAYVMKYIVTPMLEAKRATKDALEELRRLRESETPELGRSLQIGLAQKKVLELNRKITALEAEVARDGGLTSGGNAHGGMVESPAARKLRELQDQRWQLEADIRAGQRDLQSIQDKRDEKKAEAAKKLADEAKRARDEQAAASRKAEQALNAEIAALSSLADRGALAADEQRAALRLEAKLTAQRDQLAAITGRTAAQTVALAEAEERLARIQSVTGRRTGAEIGAAVLGGRAPGRGDGFDGIDPSRQGAGVKPRSTVAPLDKPFTPNAAQMDLIEAERKAEEQVKRLGDSVQQQFEQLAPSLAGILGDTLGAAFEGGLGNAKDVMLSALGGLFRAMGSSMLTAGAALVKLLPAMQNPITSGPALLAAGAVLVALGGTLSGIATGRGGSGGSGGGGASIPAWNDRTSTIALGGPAATLPGGASGYGTGGASAAAPASPTTNNVWLIGPNDPAAARQLQGMLDRHAGRRA